VQKPTTGVVELGRRISLSGAVGRAGPAGRGLGGLTGTSSLGREAGSKQSGSFGCRSVAGSTWMAQGSSRHQAPQKRSGRPGRMEKNFLMRWQSRKRAWSGRVGLPSPCARLVSELTDISIFSQLPTTCTFRACKGVANNLNRSAAGRRTIGAAFVPKLFPSWAGSLKFGGD
jgi:hypothetical protein